MKNAEVQISGLKCDNPSCDYVDKSIIFEGYPKMIGSACPKCGSILLTQADYDMCVAMVRAASLLNRLPIPKFLKGKGKIQYSGGMNGTGEVNFAKQ